jgi:CBS domain-containing protein
MSIGRICTRTVVTAVPEETILDVARRFKEYNVGTAVVVVDNNRPVGLVTDRDICIRCVANEQDPASTPVSVVMSPELRSADEGTPIEVALRTMASAGTRRLVVTGEEGRVAGVLSMDDVIELLVEEAVSLGKLVRREAPAVGPES